MLYFAWIKFLLGGYADNPHSGNFPLLPQEETETEDADEGTS